MTKRVREILGYYDSENGSVRNNLSRMLNHGKLAGSGKFVILPVDQGFEHGPARSFAINPPAYDPRYHFQLAIDAGCNAFAAPLGLIEGGFAEFVGEIPLILKVNNHDVLNDEKDPAPAMTASVKDALRLGAAPRQSPEIPCSRSHAGNDAAIDLGDAGDAGQRHAGVELVADNFDGAGDARLPAGAEPVNVSAAAHAGAGAERERARDVLAGADSAVEHHLKVGADRLDDGRQHGDGGGCAVELTAAVI